MSILQIKREINNTKLELTNCIMNDNNEDVPRLMVALATLKDTLLESYQKAYSGNVISAEVASYIDVVKYSPPDFSRPMRIVK